MTNKKTVLVFPNENGYAIGKSTKPFATPQGFPLVVPTAALAEAICAEWQGEKPNKALMRLTPLACVAIDVAMHNREALFTDILPYIDTDLVSYSAGDIAELQQEQEKLLAPLLQWVTERFGITLLSTGGVMPIVQPPENQQKLRAVMETYTPWKLAAYAVAVKPLGSAVLALALVEGRISAEEAFTLGHLEEAYETRKWGEDDEKEQRMNARQADIAAVEAFLALL